MKRVVHKREIDGLFPVCGTQFIWTATVDKDWKRVTCKRCLKLKGKKNG